MRAMTAAAIAGSKQDCDATESRRHRPANGAFRMKVSEARPPATIQTIVESRRIGMP